MTQFRCRICTKGEGNREHLARELMYGTRESFAYVECGFCGCVQIAVLPVDLGRYYPDDYYSMAAPSDLHPVKRFLKKKRALHAFGTGSILGWLCQLVSGHPAHHRWVKNAKAGFESNILDVGCGAGELLRTMRWEGFSRLTGVDPFICESRDVAPGLRLIRGDLAILKERFKFIMLNHSLEHMADQEEAMRHVLRLLDVDGVALIRIPLAGSYAWRTYGVEWVQFDAPRHLYLHTRRSMQLLAERIGFRIQLVEFDSTSLQFWGSERYKRGLPLGDPPRGRTELGLLNDFNRSKLRHFEERARELNRVEDGDQACFYLRHA